MILEQLKLKKSLEVRTICPLCIYTKNAYSESECWDTSRNKEFDPTYVNSSYELDIINKEDTTYVYIPKGAKCTIKDINPNTDCTVYYKNIECDLVFEDESIEEYFEIVE